MSRRQFSTVVLLVLILFGVGAWLQWLHRPVAPPRVTGERQITHDGLAKTNLASDGSNLYFTELSGENSVIAKVAAEGGDVSRFPVTFPSGELLDVSPAHSVLLAAEYKTGASSEYPFWSYPLPGGAAQRFGDLTGQEAVWAPDGEHVLVVKGSSLFAADASGGAVKELGRVKGTPYHPRYSPDGKRVRFSVGDLAQSTSTIWEVNGDGSGLHEYLADWSGISSKCCGSWTADGHYYIFQATESTLGSTGNLYAIGEPGGRFEKRRVEKPVKITEGGVSFSSPVPAGDGRKIWAMGLNIGGAVVTYDPASSRYLPFLSGISATDLDFSPDGQWVAYVSIPEGQLWRCKRDGSERLQLTFGGKAALPRWSPDGKRIAYVNVREGRPWAIFIVSTEGGASNPLVEEEVTQIDINWSPDGDKIIFGRITQHKSEGLGIESYDLKTQKMSTIPGSESLFSPRVSPDGHYIAALSGDLTRLMLYDTKAQKWSKWQTMESGTLSYPVWAPDSKSIYFDDLISGVGAYCRAKVGESHYGHVFLQKGIERYLGAFGLWSTRAPDGSVLFVQDVSTREIYELQVELP